MPEQIDIRPIVDRLARGLVVKEMNLQDTLRHNSYRTKAATQAVAQLDGFADAVHRVVNAYGPQQILEATKRAVGDVPVHTSQGRQAWIADRHQRLTTELLYIYRDEN